MGRMSIGDKSRELKGIVYNELDDIGRGVVIFLVLEHLSKLKSISIHRMAKFIEIGKSFSTRKEVK